MDRQPLYHDSHDMRYRAPFGAVRVGQEVTLRMGILDGFYVSLPRVRIRNGHTETTLPLRETGHVLDGYYLVETTFTPEQTGQHWISFAAENGVGHTMTLCDDMEHYGGVGSVRYDGSDVPYLLTVYEKDFFVPEWFCDTVMYQIFPDRFFCGASQSCQNKPRMHARWDEDVCIEPLPGQDHYIADDFFGGNLAGIVEKLPYLSSLGVRVLYLNPIFASISNHRYNTADYETVDPLLGTNADFTALCQAARAQGIRIILDGVFSHTGNISRYFNADGRFADTGAAQSQESPYYAWYSFHDWPGKYECWWGDESLPNVREEEPSYRQYILGENGIVRRWIRAGASGFRLDVADELPDLFLDELFQAVRAEDPEGVVLGEVWENAALKEAYGRLRTYMHGQQLHSVMNYPLRNALLDFLLGRCDAAAVARVVTQLAEQYPRGIFHALMNMSGTHDVPRALSLLSGVDADALPRDAQGAAEPDESQLALGKLRLRMLFAALFFLPGNPCIYYGDEAGMTGWRDPYCRRPFPWGRCDEALTQTVRELAALRAQCAPLCGGDVRFLDAGTDLLAFRRKKGHACAVAYLNRSAQPCSVTLPPGAWRDAQSGAALDAAQTLPLPALGWRVVEKMQ